MPRRKTRKNHKGGSAWSKVQQGIENTTKIAKNGLAAATDMRIAAEKAANDIKNARERARQQQDCLLYTSPSPRD